MKILVLYAFLFAFVFIVTYAVAPTMGLQAPPPSDQIIQTSFQDFQGLIQV